MTGEKQTVSDNLWTFGDEIEVGAFHDIQGFDLNYAGVILGDSLQYSPRREDKSTRKRPIVEGIQFAHKSHKGGFNDELFANEVHVLLSRGIKGTYIYAVDKKLRSALIKAVKGSVDGEQDT